MKDIKKEQRDINNILVMGLPLLIMALVVIVKIFEETIDKWFN